MTKSALQKSGIGGFDFVINPYFGCTHACSFCYARFMLKFHKSEFAWGEFVEPKINIPDVLAGQAKKTHEKKILFSSVTDCYQPVEADFCITRRCLEILSGSGAHVSILTKSAIAQRDANLVKRFGEFTFGMSVSYHSDNLRVCFEKGTATIDERVETLTKMKEAGAKTWLFVSPYLPGITNIGLILEKFYKSVNSFSVEAINLYPSTIRGLSESLKAAGIDYEDFKRLAKNPFFWEQTKAQTGKVGEKLGLKLDEFYFHGSS